MKPLIVAVVVLSGCMATPRHVVIARIAESKLASCLDTYPKTFRKAACLAESRAYCQEYGLPGECGSEGLWTRAH